MASPQKFRSALNGFNREDVVQYIAYINSKHESLTAQLKEEAHALREELDQLKGKSAQPTAISQLATAQVGELREKCSRLEQENAALREQLAKSDPSELQRLREQLAQAVQERDAALASRQTAESRTEEELAAYRRAERMERLAQCRASQMYDQANGALADTSAQLDAAAATLEQAVDATTAQIRTLQQAVAESKQIISNATAALGAIRPEADKD